MNLDSGQLTCQLSSAHIRAPEFKFPAQTELYIYPYLTAYVRIYVNVDLRTYFKVTSYASTSASTMASDF